MKRDYIVIGLTSINGVSTGGIVPFDPDDENTKALSAYGHILLAETINPKDVRCLWQHSR